VGSGCLKPVNSLQACPDADVNEEGWYLRLAFQTASGGILPVAAKGNFQVDVSLPHLVKGGVRYESRYESALYFLLADGSLAPYNTGFWFRIDLSREP